MNLGFLKREDTSCSTPDSIFIRGLFLGGAIAIAAFCILIVRVHVGDFLRYRHLRERITDPVEGLPSGGMHRYFQHANSVRAAGGGSETIYYKGSFFTVLMDASGTPILVPEETVIEEFRQFPHPIQRFGTVDAEVAGKILELFESGG